MTLMSSAALKAAVTLISPFQVYTPDKLHQLMSESHYVVAALPSTTETEGYISAEAIASMHSDAVFINIGRGKTVDEEALIKGQMSHANFAAAACYGSLGSRSGIADTVASCISGTLV